MLKEEELLQILGEWNFWKNGRETGIRRAGYVEKLARHTEKAKEVIDIVGIRRSGKSTIMKQMIARLISSGVDAKRTLYVNFDEEQFSGLLSLELLRKLYETYRKYINREEGCFIFLDEIQNVPEWERWVASMYEKHADKVRMFVSGSSSKLLSSELSSLLSGRHMTFVVTPLSFSEFLMFRGVEIKDMKDALLDIERMRGLFHDYMENGGFPEAVLREDNVQLLKQYFNDIIFRDIVERYKVREVNTVKSIAIYLLENTSKYFTFNKLKNIIPAAPSIETVIKFVDYIESSFLIFTTKLFSYKTKDQMRYPRKVYAADTGMRNAVCFRTRQNFGQLAETIVAVELRKRFADSEIYYWRGTGDREVDFVIKRGTGIECLVQVCWDISDEKTKEREVRAMLDALKEFRLGRGLVLTESVDAEEIFGAKKIRYMPLWKWLLFGET
jgi:hypothetical protein